MTHDLDFSWEQICVHNISTAMSEEQLKVFLEAVKADAWLQEQLKAAKDVDTVVAIAKAAGFVIAAEDLKRAQAEISEEELEGVAGGTISRRCYRPVLINLGLKPHPPELF